jgi:predicted RNase H-like HicB family nuclease
MATLYFPAVIERGDEPGFSVFFPDVPGCTSAGETLQQAAGNAETALHGHVELMIEAGEAVPPPSELGAMAIDPDVHAAALILIPLDLPSSRTTRINITLPEDLLRRIDAAASNRSKFLARAAAKALENI